MIDPNEKIKIIELSEYNPEWKILFTDAATEIKTVLQTNCLEVHHIALYTLLR